MDDCKERAVSVVLTTVATAEEGHRLARALVEQGLAACAQVGEPIRSFYRWQGALCEDSEVRVTIKTTAGQEAALLAFFQAHHPYEVPQFVSLCGRGSEAYARWVDESTGRG